MDQAEVLNRAVAGEFTFDGYRIPKGSAVRILLREAHRDPAIFPDPDRFNPSRFLNRRYSADEYAPFGLGEHRCIVADLVVRLSTLFVEELIAGFTWSVLCDPPRQRGRYHWEPSRSFAIELRPRPQAACT
jgi:cytochrome P450